MNTCRERPRSIQGMRAARKCGPTRGMHSIRFSSARSRRQLRNPRQNQPKKQVSAVPTIEPKTVFVQIALQVLRAHVVVDPADSSLYQTPESFNGLSVDVARDINLRAVPDALVDIAFGLQSIVGHEIIGKDSAAWQKVFLRQAVQSFLLCVRSYASHNATNALLCVPFDHAHHGNLMAWLPSDGRPRCPCRCLFPPWYISSISIVEPSSCRPSSERSERICRNIRHAVL